MDFPLLLYLKKIVIYLYFQFYIFTQLTFDLQFSYGGRQAVPGSVLMHLNDAFNKKNKLIYIVKIQIRTIKNKFCLQFTITNDKNMDLCIKHIMLQICTFQIFTELHFLDVYLFIKLQKAINKQKHGSCVKFTLCACNPIIRTTSWKLLQFLHCLNKRLFHGTMKQCNTILFKNMK